MEHLGEIISLITAISWTATALFAAEASKRLGSMVVNIIRMVLATFALGAILWVTTGAPYPQYANGQAWLFLSLSALVGYLFGDWCLFNSYLVIGPKIGQLFMTLAPPFAAIAGFFMLGEEMGAKSIAAMVVTISGIAISILGKGETKKLKFTIPLKGILLGIGAGLGQGVGLVLSKIGLLHYENCLKDTTTQVSPFMDDMLPFASTMIRAIIGGIGFITLMALQGELSHLKSAVKDSKGVKYAVMTTLLGPVIGVSLSLMAVKYTNAGIASTLMALTPVLIIVPYAIIYKERIKFKEIVGVTISMIGVSMFFLL